MTKLKVIERFRGFTLLEAALHTGRTHQIRVHLAFIGYPVVGDPLYCSSRRQIPQSFTKKESQQLQSLIESVGGQALHAFRLEFVHPVTNTRMSFDCPMPDEMAALVDWLRSHS